MAVTPLTRVQQATVLVLVEARRLDVVPPDLGRADLGGNQPSIFAG